MRIYLVSFILSLGGSFLFSQTTPDYVSYHRTCRIAEQFFIDSDYTACFRTYDSLFKTYEFLFPRDCYTAAQLAFKVGKDSLAVEYLKKGVPFGLNADLIFKADTALLIRRIGKSEYWKNYTSDFITLREQYLRRVDWELKKRLNDLVTEDQKWRQKNNKFFNRNFRKRFENEFRAVNRRHVAFIDSVSKIKGYPGIWLTGVGDSAGIAFNNNGNLSEVFFVVLYHYNSAYVKYGDFLKSEITNGHIHPRTYAMIRDFQGRHFVRRTSNQKMFYNIWWETTDYSEEEYEQHCQEIGCPTKRHLRQLSKVAGENVDVFWWPFR